VSVTRLQKPGLQRPGKAAALDRIQRQNELIFAQNEAIKQGLGLLLSALCGNKTPIPKEMWERLGLEVKESPIIQL
jgi:hypothetical protein